MSITVRLWSEAELALAAAGSDLWLTTLLLNRTTFSCAEMQARNRALSICRRYIAEWYDEDSEPVAFYAPNDAMALRFLDAEYVRRPDWLAEQSHPTYRQITA